MRYGLETMLPINAFQKRCGKLATLEGGGGFLGLGPAPSAPPPPDYTGAARETAAGNLEAARAALAGSLIGQDTPYGSLKYTASGEDRYGNPMYTATTSLSDAGKEILANQNKLSQELAAPQSRALGYINEQLAQRFDPNLPEVGIRPGEQYQEAMMRTLAPQIEQSREALEQNLANSGIAPGSKAYERAHLLQNQKENQLLAQSTTTGFQTGLAANQNAFNQAAYARNEPVNLLASLRSGSQVTNPTFVSTPQQAVTAGPDLLGAAQAGYNAQMGDFNAKQAAQANANAGFGQLAQIGMMAFCDIALKCNIEHVGYLAGIPIYDFEYIDPEKYGFERFRGFMAQDVEKIFPEAVHHTNDGIKMVNYQTIKEALCQTHTLQ